MITKTLIKSIVFQGSVLTYAWILSSPNALANEKPLSCLEQSADSLLLDSKYYQSELMYKRSIDIQESEHANVGLIYALSMQNKSAKLNEALTITKEIKVKYKNSSTALAVGAYVSYILGSNQQNSNKNMKFMNAAYSLSQAALRKNPKLIQPLLIASLSKSAISQNAVALDYLNRAIELACFQDIGWQVGINEQLLQEHILLAKRALMAGDRQTTLSEFRKILAITGKTNSFYPHLQNLEGP